MREFAVLPDKAIVLVANLFIPSRDWQISGHSFDGETGLSATEERLAGLCLQPKIERVVMTYANHLGWFEIPE